MDTVIADSKVAGKAKAKSKAFSRRVIDLPSVKETNGFTPRVQKLKQQWMDFTSAVSSDRGYAYMQSWKDTEGEHESIRVAKMFRNWAETTRIAIHEDELMVGGITHFPRGTNPRVETQPVPLLQRLQQQHEKLATVSLSVAAAIQPYDLDRLTEACQYFTDYFEALCLRKENHQGDHESELYLRAKRTHVPDEEEKARSIAFDCMPYMPGSTGQVCGLPTPPIVLGCNYEKMLRVGYNGLIEECKDKIARIDAKRRIDRTKEDEEGKNVLTSFIIALEGMIAFARRHAALAREQAAAETNAQRKKELLKIADTCEWVPANPARDFREAIQASWFVLIGQEIEKTASNAMIHRMDQYLYPFYVKDLEEGRITRQEAAEVIGCQYVKWQTLESFTPWSFQRLVPGSYLANLNVGGLDKHGKDASNELSCMFLHVAAQVKTNQPHVSLMYHPAMAPELMQAALECTRDHGGGIPAWFSSKVLIEYLVDRGIPLTEARENGCCVGCVNYGLTNSYTLARAGGLKFLNHAKFLELALNNGVDPVTQFKLGPSTGEATKFIAFEQLEEAYKRQAELWIEKELSLWNGWTREKHFAEVAYTPFTSPLNDGTIERAKDLHKGGMPYYDNLCGGFWPDRAQSDVTDSLLAIKKVVFEDKSATMAEVLQAMKDNFVGHEKLRAKLVAVPKFGNDDDDVDEYHCKWWNWQVDLAKSHLNFMGNRMAPHRQGAGWAAMAGKVVGSLPNGRLGGTPLSDAAASPCQGADIKGPTATLNSVAKLDPDFVEAPLLNMRFTPGPLRTKEGMRKFGDMIKAYFDKGAGHVQFTIFDRETLIEAKKHPEDYRNLVVRVAGYSAFWVELTPELQDEIISRTQHTL